MAASTNKDWLGIPCTMLTGEILDKPPLWFKTWMYLLLSANEVDDEETGIKRGELFTTMNALTSKLEGRDEESVEKPSQYYVKEILDGLEDLEMISRRKTGGGLIITITEFEQCI